jgi:hypothetical protein
MEDYSESTDGPECYYGLDSGKPHFQPPSLTASNLQMACATVSPFIDKVFDSHPSTANNDDYNSSNALMLSQSSMASSLTFASNNATDSSSVRMDLESPHGGLPQQNRSGAIFSVSFVTDSNHDNHSSVSMESPVRMGSAMSLEPARKKARFHADFGGATSAIPKRNGGMDVESNVNNRCSVIAGKRGCCHVCGNPADVVEVKSHTHSSTGLTSQSSTSANPKTPKSHSLFNYFSKSGGTTVKKGSQLKPSANSLMSNKLSNEKAILSCRYCDKPTCATCTRPCEKCSHNYCLFCSKIDYGGLVEKNMCFDCFDEENGTVGAGGHGGDVDMMDL